MGSQLYQAARTPQHYLRLYDALGGLYMVGTSCKVVGIGPELFRFWLGDSGFPVAIAALLTYGIERRQRQDPRHSQTERLEQLIRNTSNHMRLLVGCIVMSYAYEVVSGTLVRLVKRDHPNAKLLMGGFDWGDIAAYTIGGCLGLILLSLHARWLRNFTDWAQERDAAVVAQAKEAVRQRRRAARRKKSGKKR